MLSQVFNRVEKKYLLDKEKYELLMEAIKDNIKPDEFEYSKICNIYYDTNNHELIRKSIEKPVYKEKVRLRSYGIPSLESKVFIEIKKKFKGIVTKRRTKLKLKEFYKYLENGEFDETNQVLKEIDYCFKRYNLIPSIYISYERHSFCGKEDKSFRLTFDTNIKSREYDLSLEKGDYGEYLLEEGNYLMEVKAIGGMPLWLAHVLAELKIYPTSFSKYGRIYKNNNFKEVI